MMRRGKKLGAPSKGNVMNTVKVMPSGVESAAIKTAKRYATAEGNTNGIICMMASDAMKYWGFWGRKEGAKKYEQLCRENGVRRAIEQSVQRRFAGFAFLCRNNPKLEAVGERVWQRIVDRCVTVTAEGELSWAMLRKENGDVSDSSCEATFSAITNFADVVGDVLEKTFPSKNAGKNAERLKLKASQGDILLSGNIYSALDGKSKEHATAALKTYFANCPLAIRELITDVLAELPLPVVGEKKETKSETTEKPAKPKKAKKVKKDISPSIELPLPTDEPAQQPTETLTV